MHQAVVALQIPDGTVFSVDKLRLKEVLPSIFSAVEGLAFLTCIYKGLPQKDVAEQFWRVTHVFNAHTIFSLYG